MSLSGFAQKGNKDVYYGNKAYRAGDLKTAIKNFESALKTNPSNAAARINLAIAQSKLKASEAAVKNFDLALKNSKGNQGMDARLNYDKGITLAKEKKYKEAIEAFEKSLLVNPEDNDARENLQKAINELKKQQKQNKPQNKKDQKKKEQNKKQQQEQQKQQQSQQKQQKMSKEQADKLLKALRSQEKATRKKIQKKSSQPPVNDQDW